MTRWRAASIHLSISGAIALIAAILIFGIWFPKPYLHAAGADELMIVLIGVDLCVGPLLTLVVFRSGKCGLKFDLVCIAVLQASALAYGMSVVVQTRPIFLVATIDRFELVAANEITDADLAQGSKPEFRVRSWSGPRLVVAAMPSDADERSDLMTSSLDGRDLQNLPKYYEDLEAGAAALLAKSKPLSDLKSKDPQNVPTIDAWLAHSSHAAETVRWLPLRGTKADAVIVVDATTAQPLGTLPLDPW